MIKNIQEIIKLNTKKVTFMAVIIGVYLVLSIFSKFLNLAIFPSAGFLKIELSDFIFILSVFLIGKFYTSLVIIFISFFRIVYLGDNVVDAFALMTSDLLFVWFFIIIYYGCAMLKYHQLNIKNEVLIRSYVNIVISLIISTVLSSMTMTLLNWWFIFDMYIWIMNFPSEAIVSLKNLLLPIVLPFNIIKFGINSMIFFSIYHLIIHLVEKLNLSYLPMPIKVNIKTNGILPKDFQELLYF